MGEDNHYSLCIQKLIEDWRRGRIILADNKSAFDEWRDLKLRRYICGKEDLRVIQGGKGDPQ